MKPAIQMTKLEVQCDKCDWRIHLNEDDMKIWIDKPCPRCGDCIIVTNEEYDIFLSQNLMIQKLNELAEMYPELTDEKEECITTEVSIKSGREGM